MRGQKPAVNLGIVLSAIVSFKERVINEDKGQKSKSLHCYYSTYGI